MSDPSEDELLTTRGMPRWVQWVAGVGVAALLGGLVIVKTGSSSSDPATSTPASTPPIVAPVSVPPVAVAGTDPVRLPIASPAADVVTAAGDTWVLQRHTVLRLHNGRWRAVTGNGVDADVAETRLVLDGPAHQLWVVVLGAPNTILQAFDTRTLHLVTSITWFREVSAAAALRGSLLFADAAGLYRLHADGAVTPITVPGNREVLDIVADPLRDRVLMLVWSAPGVELWQADGTSATLVARGMTSLVKGHLGVTESGQIWLAGFADTGAAVLDRLDPGTLRVVQVSSLAGQVGPGALLLAAGTDSLFIGSGNGARKLWCIEGRDGAPVQHWPVFTERVASSSGTAYAASGGGLVRLDLSPGCIG
jgi:hypothetical protein